MILTSFFGIVGLHHSIRSDGFLRRRSCYIEFPNFDAMDIDEACLVFKEDDKF